MRPLHLVLAAALPAAVAPAQIGPAARTPTDFTGAFTSESFQQSTSIGSALRRRGLTAPLQILPPRGSGEVHTTKLVYHAAAIDVTVDSMTDHDAYFARSADGGRTWTSPVRVDTQQGDVEDVVVMAAGHAVAVAYLCDDSGPDLPYITVSLDQGRTFLAPVRTTDPGVLAAGTEVDELLGAASYDAATGTAFFYLAYESDEFGNSREACRVSVIAARASSATVVADEIVSVGSAGSFDINSPAIAADPNGGGVCVAWFDKRVSNVEGLVCAVSTNRGLDFPPMTDIPVAMPPVADLNDRDHVEIEVAGGHAHLVFEDRRLDSAGGFDVPFYNRVTLSTGALLHANDVDLTDWAVPGLHDMDHQWIASDLENPNNVIVVWTDDREAAVSDNNYNQTWATISRDAGATWSPNIRLSNTSTPTSRQRNEAFGVFWEGDLIVVSAERSEGNVPSATNEDAILFFSQDAGASWDEVFVTQFGSTYFPGAGDDVDHPFLTVTRRRHDAVVTFQNSANTSTGSPQGDIEVSGVRFPYFRLVGDTMAGSTPSLQARGIDQSATGAFAVFVLNNFGLSGTMPGGFIDLSGYGADIDLVFDAITPLSPPALIQGGGVATYGPFSPVPAAYMGPAFGVQIQIVRPGVGFTETSDVGRF